MRPYLTIIFISYLNIFKYHISNESFPLNNISLLTTFVMHNTTSLINRFSLFPLSKILSSILHIKTVPKGVFTFSKYFLALVQTRGSCHTICSECDWPNLAQITKSTSRHNNAKIQTNSKVIWVETQHIYLPEKISPNSSSPLTSTFSSSILPIAFYLEPSMKYIKRKISFTPFRSACRFTLQICIATNCQGTRQD